MAKKKRPDGGVLRVELVGELDAHAAEAFALEVRRLVKRYAREVTDVRVETSTVKGKILSL